MERAIVTVQAPEVAHARDLEVPVQLAAAQLAELLAAALGVPGGGGYQIAAYPLGRVLQAGETLASAGVWDGAWLVLQPI